MTENYALLLVSFCKGIGPVHAKTLLNTFSDPTEIFKQKGRDLQQRCGLSDTQIQHLIEAPTVYAQRVEETLKYIEKHHIELIAYYHATYPIRLKQIIDAPFLLYFRGKSSLNPARSLAIVGTRKPSAHSIYLTQKLIEEAAKYSIQIISGMAYGIDIAAHRGCLNHHIDTLGVVAHGLDQMYPTAHGETAAQMHAHGGILTEMPLFTKLHPDLFPRRNRIIAGLSDAVLVVESKLIGGSMSTAQIARSYDREVFAFPGNPAQGHNTGCNALIKRHVAALVEDFSDILKAMNWNQNTAHHTPQQIALFPQLTSDEQHILHTLTGKQLHIDELIAYSGLPLHRITLCVLELELKGIIKVLPGKYYQRIL
jgi:DNA processing protein